MEHRSSDNRFNNVRRHPNYFPVPKQVFKHNFDSHAYCRYIPASRKSQSLWVHPFKFHATAIGGAAGAVQIAALNALKINLYDLLQIPFKDISTDVCTSFRRSLNLLIDCLLQALCAELTTIQLLALQCLQGLFRLSAHFEEKQGAMKLFATALTTRGLDDNVREDMRLACLRNLPLVFIPEGFGGDRPTTRFVAAFDVLLACILRLDTHASLAAVTFRELLVLLNPAISMPVIERWRAECPELMTSARNFCKQLVDDLISRIPAPSPESASLASPPDHCHPQEDEKIEDEEEMGNSYEDDDEKEGDSRSTASSPSSDTEYPPNPLWSHYRLSYSDISFLLSRAQFEALTGCLDFFKDSRGSDCGKNGSTSKEVASSLIDSISAFLSSAQNCNTVFLRVKVPSCKTDEQTQELDKQGDPKKEDEEEEEEGDILLRTPRLTALCALLQLLLLESNFNLVLLSLSAFTHLLGTVRQQQPQSMTQKQLTDLLTTTDDGIAPRYHRTDGYAWLARQCVACLRTALADAKMVVRVEGSRLAAALTRLPGGTMALVRGLTAPLLVPKSEQTAQQRSSVGSRLRQEALDALTVALLSDTANSELDLEEICQTVLVPGLLDEKQLVRDAAIDCLEAVAHRLGDSNLHSAYAAISSAEDRLLASLRVSKLPEQAQKETNNNNNSLKDSEEGHCPGEERESHAIQQEVLTFFDVVRARVHRHILPKQDSQGRIVRPNSTANAAAGPSPLSARMSAAEASTTRGTGETVEYGAVSFGERRKPSAGRLRGSKRLPWDPRDEVVNLSTTAPMAINLCSPANAQASPVPARRTGSRLPCRTPESSNAKSRTKNPDSADAPDPAQPLDIFNMGPTPDNSQLYSDVQWNYQSETFPRKSTNTGFVAGSSFGQQLGRLTSSALVSSSHAFESPSFSHSPSSAPMSRARVGSLSSVSTTFPPGWLDSHRLAISTTAITPKTPFAADPTEPPPTGDPPEVAGIRSKASIRRALKVFTGSECAGINGESPELPGTPYLLPDAVGASDRESRRNPMRNGNIAMPALSTGRTTFPSPSSSSHGSGSFAKNLNCEGLMVGRSAAAGHRRVGTSDSLHTPCERRPLRGQHDLSPGSPPRSGIDERFLNSHPSPSDVLRLGHAGSSHEADQSINVVGRTMHLTDALECAKTTVSESSHLDLNERTMRGAPLGSAIGLSDLSPISDDGGLRWSLEFQKQPEPDREDKVCRNESTGKTLGRGDGCTDFAASGIYSLACERNDCTASSSERPLPRSESQPLNRNQDPDLREENAQPVWRSPAKTRMPPPGRRKRSISTQNRRPGLPSSVPSAPPQTPVRSQSASKICSSPSAALNMLASTDWEEKVNGLIALSDLVTQNPAAFNPPTESISQVVIAVTTECRNLRSQVSRQAVKTLASLFRGLGRAMDSHIEVCVRVLLGKTGEASAAFLRGEVAIALDDLTRSANPTRALLALLQHGLGHKNPAVRRQCAIQVCHITERLGGVRILQSANSANRSTSTGLSSWSSMHAMGSSAASATGPNSSQVVAERVIHALGQFLLDGNQETRYYGRRILSNLQQSPDFERVLTRYLSGQALRSVREATEYLHTKGLGEPPMVTASASSIRSTDPLPDATLPRGCSAGFLGGSNVGI